MEEKRILVKQQVRWIHIIRVFGRLQFWKETILVCTVSFLFFLLLFLFVVLPVKMSWWSVQREREARVNLERQTRALGVLQKLLLPIFRRRMYQRRLRLARLIDK